MGPLWGQLEADVPSIYNQLNPNGPSVAWPQASMPTTGHLWVPCWPPLRGGTRGAATPSKMSCTMGPPNVRLNDAWSLIDSLHSNSGALLWARSSTRPYTQTPKTSVTTFYKRKNMFVHKTFTIGVELACTNKATVTMRRIIVTHKLGLLIMFHTIR